MARLSGPFIYAGWMEPSIKFIAAWVAILVVSYIIIRLINERWNLPLLGDGGPSREIKGFRPDAPGEPA